MKKFINKIIIFVFLLFLFPAIFSSTESNAGDVIFEASVDANRIYLDSSCQLKLTLTGAKGNLTVPSLEIEGFKANYLGPSTQITIINGHYSKTMSYRYTLFPLKTGKFQIPEISIDVKGQAYTTSPIYIEVLDSSSQVLSPYAQTQSSHTSGASIEDKIFLTVEASGKEVFLHEKIPVVVRLYVKDISVSDIQFPQFEDAGFLFNEYARPRQYSQIIQGINYDVVEFNVDVCPSRIGELALGPAILQLNVLYKNSRGRARGFNNIFGDDFFNDFFGNVRKRPFEVKSNAVQVNVLPVPEEGRPQDFSLAVGQFDFDVSASPLNVNEGDPITVRMKVSGRGSLKAVRMPRFKEDEDFKVYDPQIKEENGGKVLEQVLVPKSEFVKMIPLVKFTYFDPELKEYASIEKGPFPLTVSPVDNQEGFRVTQPHRINADIVTEKIGRDIIFIKNKPGKFYPAGYFFYKSLGCKLLFVIVTVIFTILLFLYRRFNRVRTDVAYARRLRAPGKAKLGLERAGNFINEGRQKEFYDHIFRMLQEYFGDKFHLPSQGLMFSELEDILKAKKISPEISGRVRDLFNKCDEVRFASLKQDAPKAKASLENCREIIDYFERRVK